MANNAGVFHRYPTPPRSPLRETTSLADGPLFNVIASTRVVRFGQFGPATIVVPNATGKIVAIFDTVLPLSFFSEQNVSYQDYSPYIIEYVKGDIDVSMDADFCIFDDVAKWMVEPSTMLFKNKCSPYQGKTMRSMVKETWLTGRQIFLRGEPEGGFVGKSCSGRLLLH